MLCRISPSSSSSSSLSSSSSSSLQWSADSRLCTGGLLALCNLHQHYYVVHRRDLRARGLLCGSCCAWVAQSTLMTDFRRLLTSSPWYLGLTLGCCLADLLTRGQSMTPAFGLAALATLPQVVLPRMIQASGHAHDGTTALGQRTSARERARGVTSLLLLLLPPVLP
eukprot:COSAG01_NODE_1215_length_11206_cov_8.747096_2_plen_167_part_00